jgi:anaerobic magnesium-protoporphyrin IX monomethyl ester cyclase
MNKVKNKILLYNAIQIAYASSDNSPSFSLMALSAYLKEKGYRVELLLNDCTDSELKSALENCLAVGFSLYTGGSKDASRMASRIKSLSAEIPLVWGGYHPTLEARQCLKNKYIEYAVRGQGEKTFEELLKHFESPHKNPLASIQGLSFRQEGKIFHNAAREASNINEFPSFDYNLYDHVFKNTSIIPYIASRGCPFSCKFCCSANFNRNHGMKFYQLELKQVFTDLEFLVSRYNPDTINFMDDNFFVGAERIKQFIEGYRKRKFKFKWTAFGRCRFFANIEEEIAKELSETSLEKVFFGVESGSQRILDMVNKKMDLSDVLSALRKIKKYGILGDFTFINGFPNETKADVLKSVRLRNRILKISPKSTVRFFVYTPLPGTETLEECVALGYSKPRRLKDWQTYEYHSFRAPWLSWSYQNFVNNISWAALFGDLDPNIGPNALMKIAFGFLKKDADFRFKYKLFSFAPEFWIVNKLYRNKLSAK